MLRYHLSGTWLLLTVGGAETNFNLKLYQVPFTVLLSTGGIRYNRLSPTWKNLDFLGSWCSSKSLLRLGVPGSVVGPSLWPLPASHRISRHCCHTGADPGSEPSCSPLHHSSIPLMFSFVPEWLFCTHLGPWGAKTQEKKSCGSHGKHWFAVV